MKKSIISSIVALSIVATVFTGCGQSREEKLRQEAQEIIAQEQADIEAKWQAEQEQKEQEQKEAEAEAQRKAEEEAKAQAEAEANAENAKAEAEAKNDSIKADLESRFSNFRPDVFEGVKVSVTTLDMGSKLGLDEPYYINEAFVTLRSSRFNGGQAGIDEETAIITEASEYVFDVIKDYDNELQIDLGIYGNDDYCVIYDEFQ